MQQICSILLVFQRLNQGTAFGQVEASKLFINLGVGFHGPAYYTGWHPAYVAAVDYSALPDVTVGVFASYF